MRALSKAVVDVIWAVVEPLVAGLIHPGTFL